MLDLEGTSPSYHDLFITTEHIKRTSIFDLGYGLEVNCTRVGGWCLWNMNNKTLVAGEYEGPDKWLRLDVAGHLILDSRIRLKEDE